MAFGNTSFDEILTTTLKNYVPRLTDNIFSARPLFYRFCVVSVAGQRLLFPCSVRRTLRLLRMRALMLLQSLLRKA